MSSINITTLPNGLRVLTDATTSVESVAVGVWVGVGTRDEDMSYNGAAHMVEHMLFKGTHKRSAREIAEVIENVGGHMNAYTSREITSYHIHLLKDDLPLALDVLADMVQHSTMPKEEVERERDVILQEIGMCFDTPDDIIFDHYYETAYAGQTLGAPILGTSDIIKSMPRDTLVNYTKRLYCPNHMVIGAAGNLDHDRFVAMVQDMFTALPDNQNHTRSKATYTGGAHLDARDLEQSHIVLGFEGIARTHPDYQTAQVLSSLLGGGMSSRLFQEVREKRGLVYSIYSFHSGNSDNSQFAVYAGTGPDKLPELIPVVCDEIKGASRNISDMELERAKAGLRSSIVMARESMLRRADSNAKALLIHNRIRSVEDVLTDINAVDHAALERMAARIFSTMPTLAALGPLDQLENFEKIKGRLAT